MLIQEKLYEELLSMPRIMSSSTSDSAKVAKLQTLIGYLQFFGDKLHKVVNSLPHLEKLLTALLQVSRN